MTDDQIQAELNRRVQAMMDYANSAPRADFDGLSPLDMHSLLYLLFQKDSVVQFVDEVPEEVWQGMPFFQLFLEYLQRIDTAGTIKLTKIGNLPRKLCHELYGLGLIKEEMLERGLYKLSKESDSIVIQNLKILGFLSGITKKRHGKLSLTAKGKKLLDSAQPYNLFKVLFPINAIKFNLGFHDGYEDQFAVQSVIGYTLYLLVKYGAEEREFDFYVQKNLEAFPQLLDSFISEWSTPQVKYKRCYLIRIFERFLCFYDLVVFDRELTFASRDGAFRVRTTPAFQQLFSLNQ